MDTFECVLALAEFKNMTRAAEHLYMTQPALSLRIQRLEKELDIQIFDRTTRPISITREGQAYIQGMIRIRSEEEKLKYKLSEIKEKTPNTVRIGLGFNRARNWLPVLIPYLMNKHPETDYQFQEATDLEIEKLLKSKELDYGITGSFTLTDDLASTEIGTEDILILIPPGNSILNDAGDLSRYSLDNPYVINIQALNGQTLILGRTSYGLTRHMNMLFSMSHVVPEKIISIGNSETSYQLAARGVGIAFKVSTYPLPPIDDSAVKPIPCVLRDMPLQRTAFLLCSLSRVEMQQTTVILEVLKQLFYQNGRQR